MSPAAADLVRKACGYTLAILLTLLLFRVLSRLATGTLAAIEARRPGNKLSRVEVLTILADVTKQIHQGQPALPSDGLDANLPAAE